MNQLKLGTVIEMNNGPWVVTFTQHIKVARGGATLRTKLRNLLTGATLERTIQPSDTFPEADIVRRKASYLYKDGNEYAFMGSDDFDQFSCTNSPHTLFFVIRLVDACRVEVKHICLPERGFAFRHETNGVPVQRPLVQIILIDARPNRHAFKVKRWLGVGTPHKARLGQNIRICAGTT
jgi:translation elongation factor P/translation initiation factor 5A